MILAFPAPAAFAATILPRGELAANGNKVEPKYVSSHDSVYRAVAQGLYPAGGGVMRTFLSVDEDISDQLRVLWTTEGYTPHAIAVSPTLPHEVRSRLQSALIAMEQSEEGRSLLDKLKIKGFEAARNEDWDDVRALNIPLLLKSEGQ
jgi:phosphonate transport system substrate-binding protein